MLRTNVMSSKVYKEKVQAIFELVNDIMCRTIGPYGSYSLIENMGSYSLTKDGYQLLTHLIVVDDDLMSRQVLTTMKNASGRMATIVGDGSTTACTGAAKFIKQAINIYSGTDIRPADITKKISTCINNIADRIALNAHSVTKENLTDVIRKTAFVSTNGDNDFTNTLVDIYSQNDNVVFNIVPNKKMAEQTKYEVISGYRIDFMRTLDKVYDNAGDSLHLHDCNVVVFDHTLMAEHMQIIDVITDKINENNPSGTLNPIPYVIVAPAFDVSFTEVLRRSITREMARIKEGTVRNYSTYYLSTSVFDKHTRELNSDFAVYVGSVPINTEDVNKMLGKFDDNKFNVDMDVINSAIGHVEEIITKDRKTIVRGGAGIGSTLHKQTIAAVKEEFATLSDEANVGGFSSKEYFETKKRLHALTANIVEITVGGENTLDICMKTDAAEDATKACESVVINGYNVGGNLAIITNATHLAQETTDRHDKQIYEAIAESFKNVMYEIIANKVYGHERDVNNPESYIDATKEEYIKNIISMSIEKGMMFDLINDTFTEDIINSSLTDIEILRGSLSVANHILSANQFISTSIVKN